MVVILKASETKTLKNSSELQRKRMESSSVSQTLNSAWSCHVLWWFLRAIHPLLSQTVCSGKHTWPVLGKWMLEALRSPEGQGLCIPLMPHEECFIGQPWGSANFKGRERVLLSNLKGPFPPARKKHRCWPLTWPPTGFQFKSCPLCPAHHCLCLVLHKPAPAPHTIPFL